MRAIQRLATPAWRLRAGVFLVSIGLFGCGGPASGPSGDDRAAGEAESNRPLSARLLDGPTVRVIGTVQDGGLPHAACSCSNCDAARTDPARRGHAASLAILLPPKPSVFLIDATPDIREQLDALRDVRPGPGDRVDRAPLDGVLLTHAHLGHYTGLSFFGFEAVHTHDLPVYCSPSMAGYLRDNGPWSQLVELENIELREVQQEEPFALGDDVFVTAIKVPHRDEFADTMGFRIKGPRATLLYIPDTDSWKAWTVPIIDVLADVDIAILDGSFYSAKELPGRAVSSIGHPLITDSMDLLEPLVAAGKLQVFFTHLNHSNPALDPMAPERIEVESRGFAILSEGQKFEI